MSGFDVNEASNYFLRYPTAQGAITLQDTTVSGNLSIVGNTSITNTTDSSSITTGAFVVAGGMGIAKDLYVGGNIRQDTVAGKTLFTRNLRITDISGTAPVSGEAAGEETYLYGNTWVFENKGGNGSFRFQSSDTNSLDTKSMKISYDKVEIEQATVATSKTTGALTVVGGISTQNNVYAGGSIVASGAAASVSIYPTTPAGAVIETKSGIILTTTYPGGLINENDTAVSFGINTKQFGLRNTGRAGAMVRLDVSGTNPLFSVLGQPVGSGASADPTALFSIDANGNTLVQSTSVSTSTSTGALQVAGGVGIVGNVNVGDVIRVFDGANVGTLDQSGTELRIISTGNIAMTGNVQLTGNLACTGSLQLNAVVFGDGTVQATSAANNDIMSDCDFHTFVYNQANPGTPKTFLSASYALSQTPSSAATDLSINTLYFWPVHLVAGQTVNGVAFWVNAAVSARVAIFRGYDGTTTYSTQKTINSANITTGNNAMTYTDMSTPWVVDWTGIHYVCILLPTTAASITSTPSNTFANFGDIGNLTGGTLSRVGCRVAGTSIPANTSGLTITTLSYMAYVAVY